MENESSKSADVDFWQHHSLRFLEMAFETHRRERLEQPHGYGKASRECGDTVEFFLLVRDNGTLSVSFEVEGCLFSVACANAMSCLAEGKPIREARLIDSRAIEQFLETLPESESHCAELSVKGFRLALDSLTV